jgi:predicted polyphosphate/ATP-dependent NAD kinase
MKRLGLIVNPVAGLGGRVGLKGTDGPEVLARARGLGAVPEAPRRAEIALAELAPMAAELEVMAWPGDMGEKEAKAAGLTPRVIGTLRSGDTAADDTVRAGRALAERGVDLLLFAGGDGTARDVLDAVGPDGPPVLGVPAGVKIHSAVFAVDPRSAGRLAARYLVGEIDRLKESEVMDIDEEAFRLGRLSAKLYGFLKAPAENLLMQGLKAGGFTTEGETLAGMAAEVVDLMVHPDELFLIGPGTTTRAIMDRLGLDHTLLGVDAVLDRRLVETDLAEGRILELTAGRPAKIVVTVIGGQGHLFGRGNHQLSPAVIRRVGVDNVVVTATQEKLASLGGRPLVVDTGDPDLDRELSGYAKVICGRGDYVMYPLGRA